MTQKLNELNDQEKDTISKWEYLVDLHRKVKEDPSPKRWQQFGLEMLKFTGLIILKLIWRKIICYFFEEIWAEIFKHQ